MPEAATIILLVHKTKQKTDPTHAIITMYRRPRPHPDFIANLQKMIDDILTIHPLITITIQGDLNKDLLQLTTNRRLKTLMIENGLHTTIISPTRQDPVHKTKTLIDTILTTATVSITAGTISPPISDHLPIYAIFHQPISRKADQRKNTLSKRHYRNNKQTIIEEIEAKITETQRNTDPNTTNSQHFTRLQQAIRHTIEKHEKRPKQRRSRWTTPFYRRQIKRQHELHRRATDNPTEHNIRAHRQCRNKLRRTIWKAKRQSFKARITTAGKDPKLLAKVLKEAMPGKARSRTSPTVITYEDNTYTDPTDIANAMNDHYITIGHKTSKSIPPRAQVTHSKEDHPSFTLRHTTTDELTKIMKTMNRNKASDIHKIKPTIIRDLTPFLAPILTELFNEAIDNHDYPDALKFTKVIELYKGKDRTSAANYRPISLLPIIAKLLDTLLNNQIMDHLTKHNIISPTQYAFRPNSSTTLALETIIDNIHKCRHKRHPTLAIYVDLSKAYDTVSHTKLLHKLQNDFNFTPETTAFFASYFRNRTQSTHTQHGQSRTQTITHGIPQGSTLSTTFFLLYTNDIIKTVPRATVYTYADDTTLIVTAPTLKELQTIAQTELNSLINYFHANNLVPNPTKTNFSVFYPRKSSGQIVLKVHGTTSMVIKQKSSAKLLGIMVQDDLKFHQTIINIIKKLQPTIQSMRYATRLLPHDMMVGIYYSLVFPHLIGAIPLWGTDDIKKTYIQPLIRTQKKIIRIIVNRPPGTHTGPIMTKFQILNLTNLYIHRVCVEMHPHVHHVKQLNGPEHNHNYIWTAQVHDYPTRHSRQGNHYITNPNAHRFSKTKEQTYEASHFATLHSKVWNKLPTKLKDTRSIDVFKKDLKKHLLSLQHST
jgi:hypothetical protein